MTRLLAPYALPIAGAAIALICALAFALWVSVTSHAQTRIELNAAISRIENIKTAQEINSDVQSMDDTSIGNDLDKRLSDGGQ